jgi:hypothetical protein
MLVVYDRQLVQILSLIDQLAHSRGLYALTGSNWDWHLGDEALVPYPPSEPPTRTIAVAAERVTL